MMTLAPDPEFDITTRLALKSGCDYPEATSLEQWAEIGRSIWQSAEGITWELADWAAFGDRQFGKLKEFCERHAMNYDTVKQYAWVARSVQKCTRVHQLSFFHHREVAALPEPEQGKWLARALQENLSTAKLRALIREACGDSNALISDGEPMKLPTKHALDLLGWLEKQPSDFWTPTTKEFWKGKLKPIVEFWEGL